MAYTIQHMRYQNHKSKTPKPWLPASFIPIRDSGFAQESQIKFFQKKNNNNNKLPKAITFFQVHKLKLSS